MVALQALDRRQLPQGQLQAHRPLSSELEWRFNNRGNDHIFIDALRRIVQSDKLTYRELTEGDAA